MGHIGLQLAKCAGATVYALVSSEEKATIARKLGLSLLHTRRLTLHLVYRLIPILYGVGRLPLRGTAKQSRQGEILNQIAQLVDAGHLQPLLDTKVFNRPPA